MTLLALLLVTLAMGVGLLRLRADAGFQSYLGSEHPSVIELEQFIETFGGGMPIAMLWSCHESEVCNSVFEPASIEMAHEVATQMRSVASVVRVESPATSSLVVPVSDGIAIRRLYEDGALAPDHALLADFALADPLWQGSLVSKDGRVGALWVDLASSDSHSSVEAVNALLEAIEPFERLGFEFHLVGHPISFVVAAFDLVKDVQFIIPLILVLMGCVLQFLFRSFRATLATLAMLSALLLWALGMMGWLGWPVTVATQPLGPVVIAIGICDAMHLLARYATEQARTRSATLEVVESRKASLQKAVGEIAGPCVMTSATTAGGFLAFTTSNTESFVQLGLLCAWGVFSALVLSFTLLPILLTRVPSETVQATEASHLWQGFLKKVVRFSQQRALAIVAGSAVVLIICGIGMARIEIDVDIRDLVGRESRVARWMGFMEANLRETDSLELTLEIPSGQALEDPTVQHTLEDVSVALGQIEGLGRPRSIRSALQTMSGYLHGEAEARSASASSPEENAELLFLLSLEAPHLLHRWVSLDQRKVRVSFEASGPPQSNRKRIMREVDAILGQKLSDDWGVSVTGPLPVYREMMEGVAHTQRQSLLTAGAIIFVLLGVFFRSARSAALGIIPALLPVVLVLGFCGLIGVYLDVAIALVGAIVLGVAVDDTIHLLRQYDRRRRKGMDSAEAMEAAMLHVGRALITTSAALSLGFLMLMLSSWDAVANIGRLTCLAVLAALIATLLLVPALVALGGQARRA